MGVGKDQVNGARAVGAGKGKMSVDASGIKKGKA